jgi:cobalt transporter subunit CbtB
MNTARTEIVSTRAIAGISARAIPALVAFLFGLTLFVTAGFAWPSVIHNATHDTRHALGLPCH